MYSALIFVPFISVIILNLPLGKIMKRGAFYIGLLILAAQIYLTAFSWANTREISGFFLKFGLVADDFSRLMLLCIAIVLSIVLFVRKYAASQERLFNFVSILLLMLSGMNGVVLVRDIFSLYVFLEIVAVASFILIAYNENLPAFEGAFKYLVLSVVATVLMLASIALLLMVSGDTSFTAIGLAINTSPDKLLISFAIGIFLCALFIKAGLMPFHGWLPDAYSAAPASISVLLAGIVTKTVGVYTLIRIVTSVFGFSDSLKSILLIVGAISVVIGALAALGQSDFKRMLAYSSISQVGYIILGLGSGTALGLAGAAFHLFNHAIFKSLLFVNSTAVEMQAGTRDMDKLSGLAKKMPLTGITSILGCLSCAGIPPLAGFWSKLIIIIALWLSGLYVYAAIAVLASVLTLAYFLSLQRRVFFGKLGADLTQVKEAGFNLAFPALILAAITVAVGVSAPYIISTFVLPIGNILGG